MSRDGTKDAVEKYPDFKYYAPEDMKGKSIRQFIYNPKEKTFFGRTRRRWGICLLFYLIFYSALAFMWITMFYVSMAIYLSHGEPWLLLDHSRIGGSPALVQYPSENVITITSNITEFSHPLNKLLSGYRKLNPGDYTDCSNSSSNPEDCYFDANELGNCTFGGSYGYDHNMPCVMFRLNKVYSWAPKVYSNPEKLPNDMPSSLKDYINSQESQKRHMIWLSCLETTRSQKYLKGYKYWPGQGFPAYFYPFKGKKKHLSPIVAVQFESSQSGVSVKIECRAWAEDLKSTTTFTIIFKGQ